MVKSGLFSRSSVRIRRILHVFVCAVYVFSIITRTTSVFALSDKKLDEFSAGDIMFYDPDSGCNNNPKKENEGVLDGNKITYIGDSLSEQIKDSLKNKYSGIDIDDKEYDGTTYKLVKHSKHFSGDGKGPNHDGITIAKKIAEKKEMREYLIFALGTNDQGSVTTKNIESLVSAVGKDTKIMLVTNFGLHDSKDDYEKKNNKNMRDYAEKNENVVVADWYSTAIGDSSKYIDDSDNLGVHLTNDGKTAFLDVIVKAVESNWGGSTSTGDSDNSNKADGGGVDTGSEDGDDGGGTKKKTSFNMDSSNGGLVVDATMAAKTNKNNNTNSSVDNNAANTSSDLSSYNKNYAGVAVWSESELETIQQNSGIYKAAADKYGFPWQVMAVLHYMEYSLQKANPSNGQGIYQLYSYTNGGTNSNAFLPAGAVDDTEFARQTNLAAEVVNAKYSEMGYSVTDPNGVKAVLFAYNGTAQKYKDKAIAMGYTQEEANRGEGSTYVMNRFDAPRDPEGGSMNPNWKGGFPADNTWDPNYTSPRMGTYVHYVALGGMSADSSSSSSDNCPGGGGGGVNASGLLGYVQAYAWPEYKGKPYLTRQQAYADAVSTRSGSGLWIGGSVDGVPGIDCGGFVTTVINDSGFDSDYNYGGNPGAGASNITYGQLPWLEANSDKWELVNSSKTTPISDESVLSPGDVAFSNCSGDDCGHTYLYIGSGPGFETHIASASYSTQGNGRAPMSGKEYIITDSSGNAIRWYHKK